MKNYNLTKEEELDIINFTPYQKVYDTTPEGRTIFPGFKKGVYRHEIYDLDLAIIEWYERVGEDKWEEVQWNAYTKIYEVIYVCNTDYIVRQMKSFNHSQQEINEVIQ